MLNADALDVDALLDQLRTTGIGAVEAFIDESFRQRLVLEADGHFEETSTAEVEVCAMLLIHKPPEPFHWLRAMERGTPLAH